MKMAKRFIAEDFLKKGKSWQRKTRPQCGNSRVVTSLRFYPPAPALGNTWVWRLIPLGFWVSHLECATGSASAVRQLAPECFSIRWFPPPKSTGKASGTPF